MLQFSGNFTQQEPLSQDAIDAALAVMEHGRLHRYNVGSADEQSETALLELEFARYQDQRYCLACASGGYALQLALRAWGLSAGQAVLTNAFTLSPVPGAIDAAGGKPVLIESSPDLVIDLKHLSEEIQRTGAKVLLLSHMRGHLADMDALMELLNQHRVSLIEDCAHTMGASFNHRKSGTHGIMSAFSTQTYKHLNSGEGGLLTSNDDEMMARAIILSGSYMLYDRHLAAPPPETFKSIKQKTPNCSGRMDNLRAAVLRPQLHQLDHNAIRWNERYKAFASALEAHGNNIQIPKPHHLSFEVRSSIQFLIPRFSNAQNATFLKRCAQRGVELKWFGDKQPQGYTSRYESWEYLDKQHLPATDDILLHLYDCRLPLTFSVEDCALIGRIICEVEAGVV